MLIIPISYTKVAYLLFRKTCDRVIRRYVSASKLSAKCINFSRAFLLKSAFEYHFLNACIDGGFAHLESESYLIQKGYFFTGWLPTATSILPIL